MKISLSFVAMLVSLATSASAHAARVDSQVVLSQARAASGGAAWSRIHNLHIHAALSSGGHNGTVDRFEDVATGRFLRETHLSTGESADGFDGISVWTRPAGGVAYIFGDADARLGAIDESFRVERGWWFEDRHPASSEYYGKKTDGGQLYDLIRITPEAGRPIVLWVNRSTHLIERAVERQAEGTLTIRYGDYRWVSGVKIPFKIVREDEYVSAETENVESVDVDQSIADVRYSVPFLAAATGQNSFAVPFRLTDRKVMIDVSVNGKGPFEAEFDSGGDLNIGSKLVDELGLKVGGAIKMTGGGEGSVTAQDGVVDSLSVGGAIIEHARFSASPNGAVSRDLLVGSEILLRYVVRLDFETMTMTLTRPDAFDYRGNGAVIPFHFQDNEPEVFGAVDGIAGVFTVDTGGSGSLLLIAPFARRYSLAERYHASIPYGGMAVTATHGVYARAGEVTLNGADGRALVRIERPITRISQQQGGYDADRYVSGNIEIGILKQFNVTFDYARQRIILEPNRHYGEPDVFDRSGMRLKFEAASWTVAAIFASGAAEQSGIHEGDVITAIDGKPRGALDREALRAIMTSPVGTIVRLAMQGDPIKEVSLTLRDIL